MELALEEMYSELHVLALGLGVAFILGKHTVYIIINRNEIIHLKIKKENCQKNIEKKFIIIFFPGCLYMIFPPVMVTSH